jgi:hypothetical protein
MRKLNEWMKISRFFLKRSNFKLTTIISKSANKFDHMNNTIEKCDNSLISFSMTIFISQFHSFLNFQIYKSKVFLKMNFIGLINVLM